MSKLIAYPFTLNDSDLATLYLPKTLSIDEVDRLIKYINSIFIIEVKQ